MIKILDDVNDVDVEKVPVCYYKYREGELMRKWRPPKVPANEGLQVVHQIVLPKVYRAEIMKIEHEQLMSGHLGVRKK